MADDSFVSAALTGRWTGFYRQNWEEMPPFPIVAEIVQDGTRLSGEMYDQVTEVTDSLEHILSSRRAEIPHEFAMRIESTLIALGSRKMRVTYRLPDTSDIEGTILGERVDFTKSYRGSVVHHSTIDGEPHRLREVAGHKVYYSGEFDAETRMIAGRWVIRRRGFLSRLLPPRGWGTFELYKKS